jgi:hypothetical protein
VQIFKDGVLQEEKPTQIPPGGGSRELTFELDHPDTGIFNYEPKMKNPVDTIVDDIKDGEAIDLSEIPFE